MSHLTRYLAAVGGVAAVVYAGIMLKGDMKTPGMANIEARHSAAGGGDSHTPARASPLGNSANVEGTQSTTNKGVTSASFKDKVTDQMPEANSIGKAWNKANYNTEQGKHGSGNQ